MGYFLSSSFWWDVLMCLIFTTCLVYGWYVQKFNYWSKRGVHGPPPSFPAGHMTKMITGSQHIGQIFEKLYAENKNHPFIGVYMFYTKVLLVNDLDLIKNIIVKDFNHFTDHGFQFDEKVEPLSAHLFHVNGSRWKSVRHKMTPAFTTSKMKGMFEFMVNCAEEMTRYLEADAAVGSDIDMKDAISKFSTDVIVSCAFGIERNSFKNPNNDVKEIARKVFDLDIRKTVFQFMTIMAPGLLKMLKFSMLDKSVTDFFVKMVGDTVKYREENNVKRNDILQLLMRLKNNQSIEDGHEDNDEKVIESKDTDDKEPHLTMMELTAQSFGLFFGGYETSSTMSSFILNEVAKNPEIQSNLTKEIDEVLARHGGKTTYEALSELTYMGQVIEESLRLYPSLPILFRVCTTEYTIPGTEIKIEKGTSVIIPILGIQKDPDIYPDPEVFDPSRFLPENKAKRHHFSFLSFGEGPRMCIGNRFSMLQIRVALVSILRYYHVESVVNSNTPIEINNRTFFISPKKGITLKITKRSK